MNCRTATRMIAEARDRALSRRERLALALHRCICTPCRRFRRDLARMQVVLAGSAGDWAERRVRIRSVLREAVARGRG